ncbi:antitoxin [Micrococcales bacterium 31B]|nr:antitoxin [Micrococcales bacterium 31B]
MVDFGGAFDKAKDLAAEHGDKLEGALDKVAEVADEKTGGKFSDQIQSGVDSAKGFLASHNDESAQ